MEMGKAKNPEDTDGGKVKICAQLHHNLMLTSHHSYKLLTVIKLITKTEPPCSQRDNTLINS